MKRYCGLITVLILGYICIMKMVERLGFISLDGITDIVVLILVAVSGLLVLVCNDAEVNDE